MKSLGSLPELVRKTVAAAITCLKQIDSRDGFVQKLLEFDRLVENNERFVEFGGEIIARGTFEEVVSSIRHDVEWPIRPDPSNALFHEPALCLQDVEATPLPLREVNELAPTRSLQFTWRWAIYKLDGLPGCGAHDEAMQTVAVCAKPVDGYTLWISLQVVWKVIGLKQKLYEYLRPTTNGRLWRFAATLEVPQAHLLSSRRSNTQCGSAAGLFETSVHLSTWLFFLCFLGNVVAAPNQKLGVRQSVLHVLGFVASFLPARFDIRMSRASPDYVFSEGRIPIENFLAFMHQANLSRFWPYGNDKFPDLDAVSSVQAACWLWLVLRGLADERFCRREGKRLLHQAS